MPGPDSARSAPSLRQHLRSAATERLGYKGAALFFALVLWVIARAEEPVEEIVPVRIAASYDSMRVLAGPLPPVRALVVGRARDLLKLYDEAPVIRRAIPPDAPESVRFELRPSDVFLPSGVQAQVHDVQPRFVTLRFDVQTAKRVPVVSRVVLLPTLSGRIIEPAAPPRLEPDSVVVTGERDRIARIESVATAAVTLSAAQRTPVTVPLDLSGLDGVRVSPPRVRVVFPAPQSPATSSDSARSSPDSARVARSAARSQP